MAFGIENIPKIVQMEQSNYPAVNIYDYLNISFNFDEKKKAGIKKSRELAKQL